MTLEDLKKHVRPLAWKEEVANTFIPFNCIDPTEAIVKINSLSWFCYADLRKYRTKEEAMQAVEEYNIRELAKFFILEDTDN